MPTIKQQIAAKEVVGNGGNVTQAMITAGYSKNTANTPQKLTESKGWNELMEDYLSDEELGKHHQALLEAKKVEHMTFPLGPIGEDDPNLSGATPNKKDDGIKVERTTLTDQEIKDLLLDVGCKVKRIVHGETARHVYFWASDNKARKEALDMAYKLKGKYAAEKHVNLNVEVEASDVIRQAAEELNDLYRTTSIGGNGTQTGALGTQTQD